MTYLENEEINPKFQSKRHWRGLLQHTISRSLSIH